IFGIILSDRMLKVTLPISDGIMIRLCPGSKIIGILIILLMEVDMNMRHPPLVFSQARPAFLLNKPGPVTVQIKIIVIGSSTGPRLMVLPGIGMHVGISTGRLLVPADIAVASVGIEHRINNHYYILQPSFGLGISGPHQLVEGFHGGLAAGGFIAVHIITEPYDGRFFR